MARELFITAREFICYAVEYYHSPNTVALAKVLARHIQLDLTPMSDRATQAADDIVDLLLSDPRASWSEVKSQLHRFAAYASAQLESER